MILTDNLNFLIVFFFLIAALLYDLKYREIPNWIPFSILISSIGLQILSQSLIEALSGFFLFFAVSLSLYHKKVYYGGDHKVISAIGPVIFFQQGFTPNLFAFILFFTLFSMVAIFSESLIKKNGKEKAFMPEIITTFMLFYISLATIYLAI